MTRIYRHDPFELALRAMPGTLADIAAQVGAHKSTVNYWVRRLRNCGWAHVGDWQRTDGPGGIVPVFHAGQGRDAACKLKPFTKAEITARYMKNMRATGEYEFWRKGASAKQRVARMVQRNKGRPATPWDALMM